MHGERLDVGKLPMAILADLLERYGGHDERLVVGPRVGEDAAVLDMGDRYLVVKSDPITFATDEIGWYVVHVNANDIATMGGTPRWLLLTLLLPEKRTDRALVESIIAGASEACRGLGITLCGGHTEITHKLGRPIVVGLMIGELAKVDLIQTSGAEPGDDVLLVKGIAVEGTAVLARELDEDLAGRIDGDLVARARNFLHEPGISVVRDAEMLRRVGQVHAMHDPTEGGVATGLWELALASGQGIVIDRDRIPVYAETEAFCQALRLDPLGLLASGALLAAVSPADSERMVEALREEGVEAAVIGRVVGGEPVVKVERDGGVVELATFERDELARVFEEGV